MPKLTELRLKKILLTVLKLGLPACIFAYLLWNVPREDYVSFWEQPKQWHLLAGAQLLALTAIIISIIRWQILILAFEIPFTVREALRLGFLGYLLNFVSFGSVGGDVFKAILVARDKPQKRPEAVSSVLLDRAIGLFGLLLLAWISLSLFAASGSLTTTLHQIKRGAAAFSLAATLALAFAILSGDWFDRLITCGEKTIPLVGQTLARMARAIRLLRKRPSVLLLIIGLSLIVHTLLATSFFLISAGIYESHPNLKEHFMVVPPGMAAGALPLAPGGLGYQEGALAGLFKQLPDLPEQFSPILVATVFRLVTIAIAGIGLMFYLTSRKQELSFVASQTAKRDDSVAA